MRGKLLIVKLLDVVGFRVFFELGSWLIGCSARLDRKWNTGLWEDCHEDEQPESQAAEMEREGG